MRSSEPDGAKSERREQIKSVKMSDFFDLVVVNTKSNSWRITIHLKYLLPTIFEIIYRS